ncbi:MULTISPECIES: hypothetical protein [Lactobacillus]|uniref:Uncharacterized protein n=1 Tax=Lactobacillus xujianguonis TaxID=2495899 RepID=A0A437SV30_9LACO|nr:MULTISPECIES: hypothetical protein [Lactobacillus]RVU70788.1 hypothetical protein EJK17_05965 [Lactobacillus xujianguonis]RVU73949.1 hypothetical protein EJK20_05250 [Lactobacillus xujianguonis]
MVAIICDIILILLLIFLVFRLFKFSNADVGPLSKPYLAFVALCMLGVLLSWYLFEKTLKEFRPSQGKSSMFYAGLVSLCLSVPIKIKAIICEKEVAHEIEKPSEVEEVFRPFYHSIRLDGSNSAKSPRKTSIEDAAKDMYKMGMIFTLFIAAKPFTSITG